MALRTAAARAGGLSFALAAACGPAGTVPLDDDRLCAGCHVAQAEDHARSAHGAAGRSAAFVALRAARPGDSAFCDGCHRPAHGSDDGMGCASCHAAVGNTEVANGRLLVDLDGPVRGPTGDAPGAPHATVRSSFLGSSDLCGTCHEVRGPPPFREHPYTRWRASAAAAAGVGCPDCHLGLAPGTPGPRGARAVHAPVGFRTPDDAAVEALLRAGLEVDGPWVEGDAVELTARARIDAHAVPDGATFARRIELVVTATLADGRWVRWDGADDPGLCVSSGALVPARAGGLGRGPCAGPLEGGAVRRVRLARPGLGVGTPGGGSVVRAVGACVVVDDGATLRRLACGPAR